MGELRRLYYQTKEIKSFRTFKWLLKGRWNQGTGNSGNTRTYLEWDELGISYVGSGGVKYGPTYWTVDSYSSSGSLFSSRPASEMFDGEWGTEGSKSDYKNINDTDGYVEIIIHTTSGEAIVPNGVGLISCNNQSSYASSTPAHFILYGLNESTNEYVELIDVGAASVNKGNTQTTTVTFDPVEVVTGTHYLLAPSIISKGSGLRFEMPDFPILDPHLVYLTYFDDVPTTQGSFQCTPLKDTVNMGKMNSITGRFLRNTLSATSGIIPSGYIGINYLSRNNGSVSRNDGMTWSFPYTKTDPFTVMWWGNYNQDNYAYLGPQIWTNGTYNYMHSWLKSNYSGWGYIWYADSSSLLTAYNGASIANKNGNCVILSPTTKNQWHHYATVSDGENLHFYIDGIRYAKRSGNWKSDDFTKFLMFENQGGGGITLSVTEIAIYDIDISTNDHNNITVPESPLRGTY